MNPVINLQVKSGNINIVEKLIKAQHAIAKLDQAGLMAVAVTVEKGIPNILIEAPEDEHSIRDTAQPFGTMQMVEQNLFGKLNHYIMWHETNARPLHTKGENQ